MYDDKRHDDPDSRPRRCEKILAGRVSIGVTLSNDASTQPARDRLEGLRVDCICRLLYAAQGSDEQHRAEQRLLELTFDDVDQQCRRRYLPEDEGEQAALQVVERLRRNNYSNLRAFARWHSASDRSGVHTVQSLRATPARSFELWLRQLCRWEVRRRLRRLCRAPPLEAIDLSALPDPGVALADEQLLEREMRGKEGAMTDLAYAALDERQREALRLDAEGRAQAIAPGERHAHTRRCYERIAAELGLGSPDDAADFIRVARQRLRRALYRLYDRFDR
ncbi:MAG TPA: hypothetical protein VFS43_33495 [Polyangiaceae bacterium]|nr:hypothetical protein [Polyangiaceae bacterium]